MLRDIAKSLGRLVYDGGEGRLFWHTFAGAPLNELVVAYLRTKVAGQISWDDFTISLPPECQATEIAAHARALLEAPRHHRGDPAVRRAGQEPEVLRVPPAGARPPCGAGAAEPPGA
ncbi:hypothetical protein BH23VER1_BH23VER1_21000 [soil metagenome]